jgi:hypothetical protein
VVVLLAGLRLEVVVGVGDSLLTEDLNNVNYS